MLEIFRLLVSLGADVCHRDAAGNCPILYASDASNSGCAESLRILIENGADLNVKSYLTGNTPLHVASVPALKILFDNGALLQTKNDDGETPLEYGLKLDDDDLYCTKSFIFFQH